MSPLAYLFVYVFYWYISVSLLIYLHEFIFISYYVFVLTHPLHHFFFITFSPVIVLQLQGAKKMVEVYKQIKDAVHDSQVVHQSGQMVAVNFPVLLLLLPPLSDD